MQVFGLALFPDDSGPSFQLFGGKLHDTLLFFGKQELDAERRENEQLRTQLNLAQLAASQNSQTAQIIANNEAQTAALENYLNPPARPAYIVQNPNCCQNYGYTGCGCNM